MRIRRTPREAARIAVPAPTAPSSCFATTTKRSASTGRCPAGGTDRGETPVQGALRELREETGWTDIAVGPLLCLWEHDFTRAGVPVRQHEHIFLARDPAPRRDPVGDLTAAHAVDRILRRRWWTTAEPAAAAESLWPPLLPALLADVRREGPPAAAVDLGRDVHLDASPPAKY